MFPKPLAQWLYVFYCFKKKSNKNYSVSEIKVLCGSNSVDVYGFKRDIEKYLQELINIAGWNCFIKKGIIYVKIKNK